jgi:3-oxoadipate enol-lactonase
MILEAEADDGVTLRADVSGPSDAPAVLLLHSLGCDHGMWDPQIKTLASSFRLVAPDARGHGRSGAPGGDYTLDRLGEDALFVLDKAGIDRAHVCGLSMGGLVAQWLAIHAPARMERLVLANTASRIGSQALWQQRLAAVREGGMAAIAEAVLGRFFEPGFDPDIVARFRDRLMTIDVAGYAGCCAALRDSDLTSNLGAIASPTLVITGQADMSTPPAQGQALADAIPGARLVSLPAAHLSSVEQADVFTEALLEHLTGMEPQ